MNDDLPRNLPSGVWFSAVGEPLEASEHEECDAYLRGLGLNGVTTQGVSSWSDARSIANATDWTREWWDAERAAERRLFEHAAATQSSDAVLARLTTLMERSSELFHGPASVACTRAGLADPGLARAAAGAAAHSLHQYGLALLAAQDDTHAFAAKFRLFLAGRWPLCVTGGRFHLF